MTSDSPIVRLKEARRPIIVLVVFGSLAAFFIHVFTTYAIVNLEIASPSQTQSVTLHAVTGKEIKKVSSGLAIVPRGTKAMIASSGVNMKTQTAIDIPWYGFATKKISLKPDKNADKIAFKSFSKQTCPLYRPTTDTLTHYDCTKESVLNEYNAPSSGEWASRVVYEIDSLVKPISPYMGGYVSIADQSEHDKPRALYIRAVSEKGELSSYEVPPGLPKEDLVNSRIYSDAYNLKNNRFVIVSRLGDIYIGTPTGGQKVEYHTIAAPSDYDPSHNQTLCRLNDETVYCYRGHWRIGDIPQGFNYDKVTDSQMMIYSFANSSEYTLKLTSNIAMIEDVHVTAKGEIFGRDSQYLYHFAKVGNEYEPRKISVYPTAVGAGETIYYVHDNAVYTLDEKDPSIAYQVFYSANVIPTSIYAVDGKVFILGTNPKNTSVTFAYKLLDEQNLSPGKRLIDILPDMTPGNPLFYSSDLVGDRINFSLNIRRYLSPQQFDEEFAVKRDSALNFLQSYEVPFDESKVTFRH